MRHRLRVGAAVVAGIGGLIGLDAAVGSAAPQPARQHVTLVKLCPRTATDPTFVIRNVTDDASLSNDGQSYAAEALSVTLRRGANGPVITDFNEPGPADDVVLGDLVLAPGQTLVVTAEGNPWDGPVYAAFEATYRDHVKLFQTRQTCSCEDESDITTTTVPTTTTAPTTTTTTIHVP